MTKTDGSSSPSTKSGKPKLKVRGSKISTDIIDLGYLLPILVKWSWVIILSTGIAAVNGIMNMHDFVPQYTARIIVKPLQGGSAATGASLQGTGTNLLGALGGLTVNVASSGSEFDRLIYRMSSLSLARVMDEKYAMMSEVYGTTPGDSSSNSSALSFSQKFRQYLKFSPATDPTVEDLARYFKGNLKIEQAGNSPFKVISFNHSDPDKALWFLATAFSEGVDYLRSEFKTEQQERRSFLNKRLAETRIVELRRELLALISDEIRKEMLSHGDLPVGAQVIDEPYVSKYRTEPNALRFIGVPTIIALALSTALIVLIALYRAE